MQDRAARLRQAFERYAGDSLSANEAAKRWGWNANTFRSNMNGGAPFGYTAAVKYGERLGVSADWLYAGTGEMAAEPRAVAQLREVPIIPWPAAARIGSAVDLEDADEVGRITLTGLDDGRYFAVTIHDDSMDRIAPPGSNLVIRIDGGAPAPGGYYLFVFDGTTLFRRFEEDPCRLEPASWSDKHRTRFLRNGEQWRTIGPLAATFRIFT